MKRFTMILALLLMAAMPMMAERISPEAAREVAATFLNNNGAKSDQLTDLSKEAGFPNLYIFTAEQGFVVMSADDCVQPILGYSLTGKFVAENMPSNVRLWLQGYNDEIQSATENQMKATAKTVQLWKDLREGNSKAAIATIVVAPLIQTKWNQNKYYNNLCPEMSGCPGGHAYTGCTATAMAQIMKYYNYPTKGIGSHSYDWNGQTLSADFGSTTYDWNNMASYYEYYVDDNGSTHWLSNPSSVEIEAVATLMYHCGVSANMNYAPSGSGASISDAAIALKSYFNYSSTTEYKEKSDYTDSEWITMVKNELDQSRPLEYAGYDPNGPGGHAFVCDGYNSDNYFHFNWGWAGAYNGYFSLANLDTGANNQSGQGNGVYTRDQEAIFGIQPVQCAASDPTNLTYILNGLQTVTLTWDVATNATSYNIYRNSTLIGNVTSTSFTDTAPFGTNVYYVRSVDAGGNLSLSSNSVTVIVGYQTPNIDDLEATLSGNNINFSWTAPNWCYPEYESATLNYGSGNVRYSWKSTYYAHRHLASNLNQYAGKAVYKVSTYIQYPGTYSLCIYTKSNSYNRPDPNSLAASINQVDISFLNTWYDFELSTPIILTGNDDLWVVIKQENTGQEFPTPSFDLTAHNTNAFYAGSSFTNLYDCNSNYNCAWLINTYLTDGSYTYNLYQDGVKIAQNLTETNYSNVALNDNAANQFVVKTNYYGGEAESNMVGFAKGSTALTSLELNANDKMIVTEGSKLTVSETLNDVNANNLIIENGAQLIHNSDDVQATIKKNIIKYTNNEDGWNFIASPFVESITPSEQNGLLTNTYDLYTFDQIENKEWRNIKTGAFSTIDYKTGYLYASSSNTSLNFAGTLVASTEGTPLVYDANATFMGFNLIGNPYPCNTTISRDFYIISGNTVTLAESGRQIAPCEGVFVKATGANETVNFTKVTSATGTNSKDCFDMVVTQGKANVDRARVRLNDGIGMEKFSLDDKHSQISFQQNGQDFAVAYANGASEMPISFKASQNGTYTMNIEAENFDLDYLHLIDNLTGNDIDLLVTPSYTFEAKTTNYASRFKLVFSNDENTIGDNEVFAYFNNGNIIVNEEGSLQIVDMTGRVVMNGDAKHCVSTANMPAGVYVLRLINGEKVQTQKIIIE